MPTASLPARRIHIATCLEWWHSSAGIPRHSRVIPNHRFMIPNITWLEDCETSGDSTACWPNNTKPSSIAQGTNRQTVPHRLTAIVSIPSPLPFRFLGIRNPATLFRRSDFLVPTIAYPVPLPFGVVYRPLTAKFLFFQQSPHHRPFWPAIELVVCRDLRDHQALFSPHFKRK